MYIKYLHLFLVFVHVAQYFMTAWQLDMGNTDLLVPHVNQCRYCLKLIPSLKINCKVPGF